MLIFMGKWILVSKMVFTVMLMFCTCHPAKQPVNILSQEKHKCQLFIVLWSYMSQMCKNLKGNVVKQGGKNKFYATSLLHPCMMHLAWSAPEVWELSGCGLCCEPLTCVWEKKENPRNYQFFLENSFCFGIIAAGSHCWEWGGNSHWDTDKSCPGKSSY